MNIPWYNLSVKETLKRLHSRETGLTQRQAETRLEKFGLNQLPHKKRGATFSLIGDQLKSPLIYILIIAGLISLIIHHYLDSLIILMAVFINSLVGFLQEKKTSRALAHLHRLVRQRAYVWRAGRRQQIDARLLVPGDILWLKEGDRVPAEARLISESNLLVNEAALTGEWLGRQKTTKTLTKKGLVVADQDNLVFAGTVIERGESRAIVVATGLNTELGKISTLVQKTKEGKTPFQKRVLQISHLLALIIGLIGVLILLEGFWRERDLEEMFVLVVAVAVAAIPEGLPIALTTILAVGTERILRKKAIIRRLVAAETIGAVSIICADKTGTLTEGKMKVSEVITGKRLLARHLVPRKHQKRGNALDKFALTIGLVCSEAFVENPDESREKWVLRGQATDRALFLAGIETGLNKSDLEQQLPLVQRWPFSSQRMFLASRCHFNEKEDMVFISGAPERVLGRCRFINHTLSHKEKLTLIKIKALKKTQQALSKKGWRVIAVASKKVSRAAMAANVKLRASLEPTEELLNFLSQEMSFVGLISLFDPLRPEVKDAISLCRQAGIRPIIITGDHLETAKAIARQLGIKVTQKRVLEGSQLKKISNELLEKKISQINVYARIEPKDKLRIVKAWQARNEIVAMTGDGLNDAPALKKADVGIAMGEGVDVAKETADLVLLDNSFSVIVAAIEQGRVIFDNIRKMVTYLFSDSFTEALLIVGALLLGAPFLPILPAQILWANLIEDTLPNLALIFEPREKDVMRLKPRGKKTPLINRQMKSIIFIIGILTDILLLGLFWLLLSWQLEPTHIQTLIFATLSADSLFYVFSCRSLRRSLWQIKLWQNKYLIGAVLIGWVLLLAAIYFPPFQVLLRTVPLGWQDWLVVGILGLVNLALIEATKWYFITRKKLTD